MAVRQAGSSSYILRFVIVFLWLVRAGPGRPAAAATLKALPKVINASLMHRVFLRGTKTLCYIDLSLFTFILEYHNLKSYQYEFQFKKLGALQ